MESTESAVPNFRRGINTLKADFGRVAPCHHHSTHQSTVHRRHAGTQQRDTGPRLSGSRVWAGGGRRRCGPRETRAGSAGRGQQNPTTRSAVRLQTLREQRVTISPRSTPVPISQFSPRPHLVSAASGCGDPTSVTRHDYLRRVADRKIARFEKNITKRGAVPETIKKGDDYPVGPILLGFFVFVVVGSSLFQIIRTASSAGLFF
ncbi:unnamed protein product [Urochloa humidicola]